MTEKEIKQLLKLLDKFSRVPEASECLSERESTIITAVKRWVMWYGRDARGMDL